MTKRIVPWLARPQAGDTLRRWFSDRLDRECLSQGCVHCGTFVARSWELAPWADHVKAIGFKVPIDKSWVAGLKALLRAPGWGVDLGHSDFFWMPDDFLWWREFNEKRRRSSGDALPGSN